ncbi:ExeM/NucH family extracellular endonuclease [Paraglaciecola marina]|uniref:ExeM/NucH family extracellular endonuclease n=1 Tax=Paraglaciecola marina TaxID=2500157 RepID=UPI00105F118B|nr:ExeM/NucH family extracellular endonuclease [Paraglaciecola marina]
MLKAIPTCLALAISPLAYADDIIAEQNFNGLSSDGTYTTEAVTDGTALSNTGAFNIGGDDLDFQTYWFDSRSVGDGPIDTSEGSDGSDFIGVNSYNATNSPDVSAAGVPIADGIEHNFEFNDTDGRLDVVFEEVDVSGYENRQLTINYWINEDTFESDDFFTVSISDGTSNIELYSVSETVLQNLSNGDAGVASEWQTLTVDLDDLISTNSLGETLTLTVSADINSGNENIFFDDVLFSALSSEEEEDEEEIEEPIEIGACFATDSEGLAYISAVQGSDTASPLDGSEVIVEGVVTGLRDNGFFMQEEVSDEDQDSSTSEGVFVYYTDTLPTVNHTVRILGTVDEYYDLTQVTSVTSLLDCGETTASITTANVSFPMAETDDLEHYEGMMVSVSDLTVFDTDTLWQYGELGLSNELKRQPTDLNAPLTAEYEQQIIDNAANIIYVEDDNSNSYPDTLSFFSDFSYTNAIGVGDTVTATGPLNYSFSKYRINATAADFTVLSAREASPSIDEGDVKIATFNVLNYFNGDDDGNGGVTFDYDANRGAESEEEFELQEGRIVEAIVAMDADVIGLMEIENDGFGDDSAIQSLVDAVNAEQSDDNAYSFITTADDSLIGTDAIAVGLIYRASVVTPSSEAIKIDMPSQLLSDDTSYAQMRVSLLQSFTHDESGESFAVVVNHFKSKGSGCYEDSVETTDIDSIQGSCNALRVSAAVTLGDALEAADLPDRVMILGDLNAYSAEDPLAVLTDYDPAERGYTITTAARTELDEGASVDVTTTYGYENVAETFDADGFSYWYYDSMQVGSLDHILASSAFMDDIVDATHWNINSVEVYQLQYDQALSYYSVEDGYAFTDLGPYRSSDHDPFIVSVSFAADEPEEEPEDDDTSSNNGSGGSTGLGFLLLGLAALFLRRKVTR